MKQKDVHDTIQCKNSCLKFKYMILKLKWEKNKPLLTKLKIKKFNQANNKLIIKKQKLLILNLKLIDSQKTLKNVYKQFTT